METNLTERFLNRVLPEPNTGCWLWTGKPDSAGYGRFTYGNSRHSLVQYLAHRFSYNAFKGEVPDGLVLDHLCRTRSCVNPDHLEVTTDRINILRGEGATAHKARQAECVRGHREWGQKPDGRRWCRECDRMRQRGEI